MEKPVCKKHLWPSKVLTSAPVFHLPIILGLLSERSGCPYIYPAKGSDYRRMILLEHACKHTGHARPLYLGHPPRAKPQE
jgi:hypothetical protein